MNRSLDSLSPTEMLETHAGLIELARALAAQHELDPALVCAVVEQESTWNPWLNRYEPGFEGSKKYGSVVITEARSFVGRRALFEVSVATEIKNRCTSWGLMQVMGQTARELAFNGPLAMLCEPWYGLEYGCRKLAREIARPGLDVKAALLRYNGGGNLKYADEVLARVGTYRT